MRKIRLLIIDKTSGLQSSHERHQKIACRGDVELHVFGPKNWIENGRPIVWELPPDTNYHTHQGNVMFKDYYARHFYLSGLRQAIKTIQPDIIQLLEEPWSLTAGQTIWYRKKYVPDAKLLFYTWENIYQPWTYPARFSFIYKQIDKMLHKQSNGAVCATQGAQEVLIKKGYKKPTVVIPYGIPDFFFNTEIKQVKTNNVFTIGYVGRFLQMKGVDLLLQAISKISDSQLIMVGSGAEQEQFKTQAVQSGISEQITWHEPMPENKIAEVIQTFDVLVLPSRTTELWMEQLGRVLIEAMALGVPVIGSSSGAIPEVVGNAGYIFEENNVDDLVKKLNELKENPDTRSKLSKAGRKRAGGQFSWENFSQKLVNFYKTVILKPE